MALPEVSKKTNEGISSAASQSLAELLGELIVRFTGGGSHSVRSETAGSIMESIAFCVLSFLDTLDASEDASGRRARYLKNYGLRAAYNQGVRLLSRRLRKARQLHGRMAKEILDVPLSVYHETLRTELDRFFQHYDISFGAHEVPCSMDYPLALDAARGKGLRYIETFLGALALETDFCRRFGEDTLQDFLSRYERRYQLGIADVPINLFGCVFEQALIVSLCGLDPCELAIAEEVLDSFCMRWRALSDTEGLDLLLMGSVALADRLGIEDPALTAYMKRYAASMAPRFLHALASSSWTRLILAGEDEERLIKSQVEQGSNLTHEEFTSLAEEIGMMDLAEEKADRLLSRVRSDRDLIDLLESGAFSQEDQVVLFRRLGDAELIVIGAAFLSRASLPEAFFADDDWVSMSESAETDWQRAWLEVLAEKEDLRRSAILVRARDLV